MRKANIPVSNGVKEKIIQLQDLYKKEARLPVHITQEAIVEIAVSELHNKRFKKS